jgi:hypothetical protein
MKHQKIIYQKPKLWNNKWPNGKLGLYAGYGAESPDILTFIKFIRAHRDRITIIGADPDIIDRDEAMAKTVLSVLHPKGEGYNIWYAANHHVDTGKYEEMNQKWVPNPEIQRYFAGYHLRRKLGREYCIVMTQAYHGSVRYNGICLGDDCYDRVANLEYIYRNFTIPEFKKYVNPNHQMTLYTRSEFITDKMPFFNAPYHADLVMEKPIGTSGGLYGENTKKWNYILFFNKVNHLESLDT